MRNSLAIAAVLAFVATGAVAQTQNPPAKDGPQNSAINSSDSSNRQVNAPVSGRNSFTEGEAKSRIEKMGFSGVTNLKKDENGVWRGRAMKDSKTVEVSVDYQGNVIQAGAQGTTAPSTAAQGGSRR
jgi:hypothetical protein